MHPEIIKTVFPQSLREWDLGKKACNEKPQPPLNIQIVGKRDAKLSSILQYPEEFTNGVERIFQML